MVIGKYIKKLLDERKQVVLPGFGNLEVKEAGEGVPSSGNMIDPPGTWIRFDSGFSKDNGLLASAYATGEELSGEEAGQRVLELVDSIKFALDKGEPFVIPKTGTFTRDDGGKVHFKVDTKWIIEPDQYGLESMDLLELEELPSEEEMGSEKEKTTEKQVEEPDAAKASVTQAVPTSRPRTKLADPQPQKRSSGHVNRWKIIWVVAGALIVILIALIFIPANPIRKPKQKEQVVPGTEKTEKKARKGSSNKVISPATTTTQQQATENQVPEVTDAKTVTPIEETQSVVSDNRFFIIAGSFKHLKNASDLQDQLLARSYPAEVMVTENRMYRVSVASYATKNEAERALAGVKAATGLGSCWLLSN